MKRQQIARKQRFNRWWNKKHHDKRSHYWLIKNTRRIMTAFPLAASHAETIDTIIKRFNLSEYKRLSKADAWQLYKITNPVMDERKAALVKLAKDTEAKIQELKTLRAEAKGKYHKPQPPLNMGIPGR